MTAMTRLGCVVGIGLTLSFSLLSTNARAEDPLDNSVEPIKSCEAMSLAPIMKGIDLVNWNTGSKICETATASIGQPVPVGVFRSLLMVSSLLHFKNGLDETDKIAYQLAELIEARGVTEPARMKQTLEIAWRSYNGSNGRVTPRDLNVAVRKSGRGPALSDEDIFMMAAVISVQKRNNGE